MNYLAHFHLAGNDPAMISGALLGDFVKGPLRGGFHQSLEHGIRLHRRIDAFSDSDALLSAYRRQLTPDLHRYSSIITDVVFDYHLSRHWQQFHEQTLRHFADSVYAALADRQHDFPLTARRFSAHMIEQDLLLHYGQWPVIDRVLKSIAARLPHDNPLQQGSTVINTHQDLLQQAFFDFYPRVVTMAQSYRS